MKFNEDLEGARLEGWKAIGAYFDRTDNTAQEWDRRFGLPVKRFMGKVFTTTENLAAFRRWKEQAEAEAEQAEAEQSAA